jgi:hypothetical protein
MQHKFMISKGILQIAYWQPDCKQKRVKGAFRIIYFKAGEAGLAAVGAADWLCNATKRGLTCARSMDAAALCPLGRASCSSRLATVSIMAGAWISTAALLSSPTACGIIHSVTISVKRLTFCCRVSAGVAPITKPVDTDLTGSSALLGTAPGMRQGSKL